MDFFCLWLFSVSFHETFMTINSKYNNYIIIKSLSALVIESKSKCWISEYVQKNV